MYMSNTKGVMEMFSDVRGSGMAWTLVLLYLLYVYSGWFQC